ncbi:hypothetical protein THRCLA_20869 [Thraustotheca clavata]|uniref:VPS9 domain-containing protein n=1 Tax=Thraustotheca clavata TaxID=74557 RepID=A0A1W0A2J4_9STRA|nr:hypothetical protein THRCLA_20869 [Thraustotheca clavata]
MPRHGRIEMETRALKKKSSQLDWESKTEFIGSWFRKSPAYGNFRRLRAHIQIAMHKRCVAVLNDAMDSNWHCTLKRDVLYQVLTKQLAWFDAVDEYAKKNNSSMDEFRRRSADDALESIQTNTAFCDDTRATAPLKTLEDVLKLNHENELQWDTPSAMDLAFEIFLATNYFFKCEIGDKMEKKAIAMLKDIEQNSVDVQALMTLEKDICQYLSNEHAVPATNPMLILAVRRVIASRFAPAYYIQESRKIAMDQQRYNNSMVQDHCLQLAQNGLLDAGVDHRLITLTKSIIAMQSMPILIPSTILDSFMYTISIIHKEVGLALGVDSLSLSADVIMPILIAILAYVELPLLQAQLYALESIALKDASVGGEAAYYVALLHSAAAAVVNDHSSYGNK